MAKTTTQPKLKPTALAIALSLTVLSDSQAATINVGAGCTVVDAVIAAVDNLVVNSCIAGDVGGTDIVVLPASSTHTINTATLFADSFNSFTRQSGIGYTPISAFPIINSNVTIQGNGATIERGIAADNFRFFNVLSGSTLTLESLTLSGGVADRTVNKIWWGGAIYSSGALTLNSVTLSGNTANSANARGAAIYSIIEPLTITGSTITNNIGTGSSAAVKAGGASVSITSSTISNNFAKGITISSSPGATINSSNINDNYGGGIRAFDTDLTVSGTTISGNSTNVATGSTTGSAIHAVEGSNNITNSLTITNSTITNNTCTGFAIDSHVVSTISDTSITLNKGAIGTNNASGAVSLSFANLAPLNNLFIDNNIGVGLRAHGSGVVLSNSIITNNSRLGAEIQGIDAVNTATISNTSFNNNDQGGLSARFANINTVTINGNSGARGALISNSVINNITITNNINNTANTLSQNGGGLVASNSIIDNSTISGNTSIDGSGGGIYISSYGSNTISNAIRNTVIENNQSSFHGGGLASRSGVLTLENLQVNNNTTGFNGGGINLSGVSATITNSTISGNVGNHSFGNSNGGGIFVGGFAEITNSTISGNSVTGDGGGIQANSSGFVKIENSTISGNSAAQTAGGVGAGAFYSNGSLGIFNSTINDNVSPMGGGIAFHQATTELSLTGTIIANSVGNDCNNPPIDGGNNWFEDASCNGTAQGTPMLNPLADNGGATLTHALQVGSGAIDAGGECLVDFDQIGTPRSICKCDIGAFEVLELKPDNSSCKGQFFVVPTSNGKSVIFEL